MTTQRIKRELNLCGFEEEKRNTGYYYSKTVGNIQLICFIEEKIKFYFVSAYLWDNYRIKGACHITEEELKAYPAFTAELFKKTIDNMPRYIGDKVDIHSEIKKVIDESFVYK